MTDATWAGRSANPPPPEHDKPHAGWVPVAGVVVALGLIGTGGYLLGGAGDPSGADAAAPATSSAATSTAENESTEDESTEDESTDEDSQPDATSSDATVENQIVVEERQARSAVLREGVLYLGGAVPSQDVADQIIERAEAVVGEGNVVSEYVIDPAAEMGQGAPLYIDDVVLFAYGANTYDHQFEPLLDLGLRLLSQNPSVTVTIITHTDSSGSTSFNQQLSLERGQSVAQYWIDRGIPVEQIAIDARGESDPRVDDQDGHGEGAQLNRRAEFFIEGLLP